MSPPASGSTRHRGFTLVELLVALAVASILVTVAIPGFVSLLREAQASRIVDGFIHAMRIARSEAMAAHVPTAVCQSDRLKQCTDKTDWATGWLVFQDPDDDGDCVAAEDGVCRDGGRVLLAHNLNMRGFSFVPNGNPGSSGHVRYGPGGFAVGQTSTFSLCDRQRAAEPRAVVLNLMGRVRIGGADDAECSD